MSLSTIHVSITSKVTHEINNTDRISEKCMSVKRSLQSKKNTRSELKSKEDSFLKIEKRKKTISTYQSRLTCMSRKNVSNSESLKQRKTLLENLNKSARFYRRYSCSQFKLIKRPLSPISSQNSDGLNRTSTDESMRCKTKKRCLKSSEELLIEEMSKYKFKAKGYDKQMFHNKVLSPVNADKGVKLFEENGLMKISPILEEQIESSPINLEKSKNITRAFSRTRMSFPTFYSARRISKEKTYNSRDIKKRNSSIWKESEEKYVFKARAIPDYTVKEVKLSTKYLTIPNPPKLSCLKKASEKA